MHFGETAEDYLNSKGTGAGRREYIRKFNPGETRVRFYPGPWDPELGEFRGMAKWPSAPEHYSKEAGYIPCPQPDKDPTANCLACQSPFDMTRKLSRRFFPLGYDMEGHLRIWRMPKDVYMALQPYERDYGTLSDRDYLIQRWDEPTGGNQTKTRYSVREAPDGVYPIDFPPPEEWINVGEELAKAFEAGEAKLRLFMSTVMNSQMAQAQMAQGIVPPPIQPGNQFQRITPQGVAQPTNGTSAPRITPQTGFRVDTGNEPEPEGPVDVSSWGPNPDKATIESAAVPEIKQWLEQQDVEFPPRAPRARLVQMAQEKAAQPPY